VDPDDDSLGRDVVWHFRYDAVRDERRNVVVAAFDNEQEFLAEFKRRAGRLKELQARGRPKSESTSVACGNPPATPPGKAVGAPSGRSIGSRRPGFESATARSLEPASMGTERRTRARRSRHPK
jgi:hypothetical protein